MLFDKLALALLSIVAVAAALPGGSSANVAVDTDLVSKRGSDVDFVGEQPTRLGACNTSPDGTQNIAGDC